MDRHASGQPPPRVDYPSVKMVQFTGDAYSAGIEEVERVGVRLRVYGVAKTGMAKRLAHAACAA